MAITVAGAEPDNAAKKAHASTRANAIPPLTPPTILFAKSTSLFEIPPFVIRFPARMKNGIAMIDVDSNPPKILCPIIPVVTRKSGLNTIVVQTAAPKANAIGTPMIRNNAIEPNNSNPVPIMLPPLHFFL